MTGLRISGLAGATGASAAAIRYYEQIGLLPRPARTQSDQRRYEPRDVERVAFIRRCRALGFTIREIRTFAQISRNKKPAVDCRQIVEGRLGEIRQHLTELKAIETRLIELLESESPNARCRRLDALA